MAQAEHTGDPRDEFFGNDGLIQQIRRALIEGAAFDVVFETTRKKRHGHVLGGFVGADRTQHGKAVHLRHANVRHQNIHLPAQHQFQRPVRIGKKAEVPMPASGGENTA